MKFWAAAAAAAATLFHVIQSFHPYQIYALHTLSGRGLKDMYFL